VSTNELEDLTVDTLVLSLTTVLHRSMCYENNTLPDILQKLAFANNTIKVNFCLLLLTVEKCQVNECDIL